MWIPSLPPNSQGRTMIKSYQNSKAITALGHMCKLTCMENIHVSEYIKSQFAHLQKWGTITYLEGIL
jgi:hypothetical protein